MCKMIVETDTMDKKGGAGQAVTLTVHIAELGYSYHELLDLKSKHGPEGVSTIRNEISNEGAS